MVRTILTQPHVASCYNNIGNIYADRKQLDLALEQYKISLKLRLKIFGECHADVEASYNNMAITARSTEYHSCDQYVSLNIV